MRNYLKSSSIVFFLLPLQILHVFAQEVRKRNEVNVFLGTSGDHGQLSPGAASPFGMLDIAPQTYPNIHTGYEHKAKEVLGFTHNRMEGVGCMGSGGNLLIKPFVEGNVENCQLIKTEEQGSPGYYCISFKNGISAEFAVNDKAGIENYRFPKRRHGFYIDLSHALTNGFKSEEHQATGKEISGWIESGTTCRAGSYRIYYDLQFNHPVIYKDSTVHTFTVLSEEQNITIRIALSSASIAYAKSAVPKQSFETIKIKSRRAWDKELNRIRVTGDPQEANLFYSLLYRTMQTPYQISEPDGSYRATNNSIQHSNHKAYNGWSIWDNYRTELPLLSLIQPDKYADMISSIVDLYRYGKKDWATQTEPSNTVRTEHAIVVLLDAYRKGYPVDFNVIRDSLIKEVHHLDFSKPDKALESSYDTWALSQVLAILKEDSLSKVFLKKAGNWKTYWDKDFKDLSKPDVDELGARRMYQGTIWQYRWFVPFDVKELMEHCGGEAAYLKQLDEFFDKDYYNAANEPDIQAPYMYQFTKQTWKSQSIIHKYAKDTVIQYYYDDNYRGINPTIDRVYNNRPNAFVNSMDDDAGEMSSWYVMAACGLSPACVGWPVYYLHVPLFKTIRFNLGRKIFTIKVQNFNSHNKYIYSIKLNGKGLSRNWLTQQEILKGGYLIVTASPVPNKTFGIANQWITAISN